MYVRVIKRKLSTGHVRGDIMPAGTFKAVALLLKHGAVSEVCPPPLSELGGWETRAELLAEHGIVDVVQFLEADNATLKEIFGYKTARVINRMKAEVRMALLPSDTASAKRR